MLISSFQCSIAAVMIPMVAHHQQVDPETQDDKDKEQFTAAGAEKRQEKNEQQGQNTPDDHPKVLVLH
jgi:hypothetical protein